MKKKEKDEKKLKQEAKEAKQAKKAARNRAQGEVQGFLLPQSHKLSIQWRVNPIFRATFLVLLLTLLYATILVPRWIFNQEWEKATADLSQTSLQESEWVAASLTKIRPIRNKYREIEQILQYRRIGLSPILSSIQRNIPREISINSLQWETDLSKTTDNILISGRRVQTPEDINHTARKATLTMEIYATTRWNRERSPAGWLANVESDLKKNGIKVIERNIGTERPFVPIGGSGERSRGAGGSTLEVTLRLELEGPQERAVNTTRAIPAPPSQNPRGLPTRPPTLNTN